MEWRGEHLANILKSYRSVTPPAGTPTSLKPPTTPSPPKNSMVTTPKVLLARTTKSFESGVSFKIPSNTEVKILGNNTAIHQTTRNQLVRRTKVEFGKKQGWVTTEELMGGSDDETGAPPLVGASPTEDDSSKRTSATPPPMGPPSPDNRTDDPDDDDDDDDDDFVPPSLQELHDGKSRILINLNSAEFAAAKKKEEFDIVLSSRILLGNWETAPGLDEFVGILDLWKDGHRDHTQLRNKETVFLHKYGIRARAIPKAHSPQCGSDMCYKLPKRVGAMSKDMVKQSEQSRILKELPDPDGFTLITQASINHVREEANRGKVDAYPIFWFEFILGNEQRKTMFDAFMGFSASKERITMVQRSFSTVQCHEKGYYLCEDPVLQLIALFVKSKNIHVDGKKFPIMFLEEETNLIIAGRS